MTSAQQCRRFIVSGRVQGVFFRDSTRRKAFNLGLSGWVRNLHSGEVELLVVGGQEQILQMGEWLWQGPDLARVTDVRSEPVESQDIDSERGFEILRSA